MNATTPAHPPSQARPGDTWKAGAGQRTTHAHTIPNRPNRAESAPRRHDITDPRIQAKTVFTEIGPVEVEVPRDTNSTFDPQIVKKRQRRLTGIDEIVLSLTAKGLTTGEIAAHFDDVYGATVSKDTISKITDKVIEEMTEWCNLPLESGKFPAIVANPGRMGLRCLVTRRTRCLPVSSADTSN